MHISMMMALIVATIRYNFWSRFNVQIFFAKLLRVEFLMMADQHHTLGLHLIIASDYRAISDP